MTAFSELPAPPQEKSGESKAIPERERTSIFRWLKERGLLIYMTAALSAAMPFKHERLEAADIPPGATWMEGIQTLQNGVLSDKVETLGTFYIDNQTHRGKWVLGKEGERTQVKYAIKDIKKAIESELSATPTQSFTICELHTHPLSAGESEGFISEEDSRNVREDKHSVSLPPSGDAMGGDIGLPNIRRLETAFDKFRAKGVTVKAREVVVDAAGITYHRPITDQDLKQEFPKYFAELEQRKAIVREWEEVTSTLLDNLNDTILDQLHRHTKYSSKYDTEEYAIDAWFRRRLKHMDLKAVLSDGKGSEEIMQILFAGNPNAQKLHNDFTTLVIDKAARDRDFLDEVRLDWIKTSMTVSPEQLPSTKEYTKLREAYARSATYIRFVPHQNIPNEPPCAGTDYKP
jgi:hypothetical protein